MSNLHHYQSTIVYQQLLEEIKTKLDELETRICIDKQKLLESMKFKVYIYSTDVEEKKNYKLTKTSTCAQTFLSSTFYNLLKSEGLQITKKGVLDIGRVLAEDYIQKHFENNNELLVLLHTDGYDDRNLITLPYDFYSEYIFLSVKPV